MEKSKLVNFNAQTSSNEQNSTTQIRTKITDASNTNSNTIDSINALNDAVFTGMTGANVRTLKDGSFNNSYLKFGLSDKGLSSSEYYQDMVTLDRATITSVYHSSWIFRRIIDKVAQDMWSAGITIEGDIPPEGLARVQKRLSRLKSDCIWATQQARLYGGAASLIMVNDQAESLEEPLDLTKIKKGSAIQLWTTDRWWGLSTSTEKVTNYKSRDFNTPKYYEFCIDDINEHKSSNTNIRVHHSRVLRWVNRRSVRLINTLLQGWGISELEHIYQDLMLHENAKYATSSLLDKTLLEIVKVEGLRGVMQGLGLGSQAQEQELATQMAGLNNFRMNSTVLLDKENDYTQFAANFSGVSDILTTQEDFLAGAAEMPKVLLFGETKGGLTSDSPAEMEFYAQTILGKSEEMLRPVLDKLLPVILACEGIQIPNNLDYDFESIAGITQEKQLSLLNGTLQAVTAAVEGGYMTHETGLQEIQQVQKVTGFGTNITDRDIELAKQSDTPENEMSEGEQTEEILPVPTDDYQDVKDNIEQQIAPTKRKLFDFKHKKD